ncbi:MAG: creatininase family protein, partial [Spirochaetia bacterium]|nr:creatininase family protein [Spirochaetia bacterium]
DELHDFGKELFGKLLRIGFRNIHGFIHHQSENFVAGMPTDLAFKLASRQALFDFLEKEKGEGWWGKPEMENYYAAHAGHTSPFDWIRIHPLLDAETQALFPIDHAGKQETSLMLALCPEGVDRRKLSTEKWYTRSAVEASREYGEEARSLILQKMETLLS